MRVIATKEAFYNGARIRRGARVDVPEGHKGSWFVAAETLQAKAVLDDVKGKKTTKDTPKSLSEIRKEDSKTFADVHAAPLA